MCVVGGGMVACAEIEGTQIQSQPRIHRKFHVSLCYVCYICSKAFCFLFPPCRGWTPLTWYWILSAEPLPHHTAGGTWMVTDNSM